MFVFDTHSNKSVNGRSESIGNSATNDESKRPKVDSKKDNNYGSLI